MIRDQKMARLNLRRFWASDTFSKKEFLSRQARKRSTIQTSCDRGKASLEVSSMKISRTTSRIGRLALAVPAKLCHGARISVVGLGSSVGSGCGSWGPGRFESDRSNRCSWLKKVS